MIVMLLVGIVAAATVGFLVGRVTAPRGWITDSAGAMVNVAHVRWIAVNGTRVVCCWSNMVDPLVDQTAAFALVECRNEVDARRAYERLRRRLRAYEPYKGT